MKVISGGQTGVDRAALDAAMHMDFEVGGWCPRGRRAEDGRIPDKYPLIEMEQRNYETRTRKNAKESDYTLVLFFRKITPGSVMTVHVCGMVKTYVQALDLNDNPDPEELAFALKDVDVLNVAGSRESKVPGIYDVSRVFLLQVLAFHRQQM